jgi:uncharacterized membrane protein YqhA
MARRLIAGSRYLIFIAVIGSLLASLVTLVYGVIVVVHTGFDLIVHPVLDIEGVKHVAVGGIEETDLFLLGAVLYIVAVGLYELFIDETVPTPAWLVIDDFDDLKAKITGVIMVLLAVTFLASVVEWKGNPNIVALGIAVGLVLFALVYLLQQRKRTPRNSD